MDVMKTFNVTMNFAVEPLANITSRSRFSEKLLILLYEQLLIFGLYLENFKSFILLLLLLLLLLFITFFLYIYNHLFIASLSEKKSHIFGFLFLFFFFFYAVTMLTFQIKKTISSEKWFNYVVTFFLKMLKIWVDRTMLNGEKKEDGLR